MRLRLIEDWRRTGLRSLAVWAGWIGTALSLAGTYLLVLQGRLDDWLLFWLGVGTGTAGAVMTSLGVWLGRIKKQRSISGD